MSSIRYAFLFPNLKFSLNMRRIQMSVEHHIHANQSTIFQWWALFNCSILHHPNDARSKAAGVTVFHSPHHHQGSKNMETRPSHNLVSSNLPKGMTSTLDEFKYGFPSEGLSTTSNKWWGSRGGGPDDSADRKKKADDGANASKHVKGQPEEMEKKEEEADTEMSKAGKEAEKTPEGAALFREIRKRAVEEGREALKLGVFRGYGVKKLGKREKIMLLQIFSSTLPSSWIHDS